MPVKHFAERFRFLILEVMIVFRSTPTTETFLTIIMGWILCNGKRTISGIIRAAGYEAAKSHDAYQNFFSKSKWSVELLWKTFFLLIVQLLNLKDNPIRLAGDDTLVKHYGRKIWGAGLYRDAVRSSKKHTAYAWGLNWVVLVLIVEVPILKGQFIALPILATLNPKTPGSKKKGQGAKKKKTSVVLMVDMINTVVSWLPNAQFIFCGDGAFAAVAKHLPKNVSLVSRIRCDAAVYALPKKRIQGKSGRPATKGERLPTPQEKANSKSGWKKYQLILYGKEVQRLVLIYIALWYEVCPHSPVKIVIVRDPLGKKEDEYFFTTDRTMRPEDIIFCYTGRWPIEVVFRETKQYMGIKDTQARRKEAVLRTTPFCLWLNSAIKLWFIIESQETSTPRIPMIDNWYTNKETISFQDMLGALRLHFWEEYISSKSTNFDDIQKFLSFIITSLSKVS